jgi:AraC-like DNA-binding protein
MARPRRYGEEMKDNRMDPTDASFQLVGAETLLFFPELVRDLGGDPERLLAEAHVDPSILSRPGAVLLYRAMTELLELAAERLHCPSFGMLLARRQSPSRVIGPIGVVMKNSSTLGQALGYCAKHIRAYSLATRVRFRPDRPNHRLFVGLEILLETDKTVQVTEHGLLLASLNIGDITGRAAAPRLVSFRHQPIAPLKTYRESFGCEVRFGEPADGLVLSEDDLLCPIKDADEQVYDIATSFVETRYPAATPPLHARVRALVRRQLDHGDCTNERISTELCMHPRTLQRRLRLEGTSFEAIKDAVRREAALRYLQHSDLPLTQVAEKLGYAEISVLSRSCYRWFAASPRQLRQGALAEAGAG